MSVGGGVGGGLWRGGTAVACVSTVCGLAAEFGAGYEKLGQNGTSLGTPFTRAAPT